MKTIFTVICLIGLAGSACAFELQGMDAAGIRALETAAPAPAARQEEPLTEADLAGAERTLVYNFEHGDIPYSKTIAGHYEGRIIYKDSQGRHKIHETGMQISTRAAHTQLGPLFDEGRVLISVTMPYDPPKPAELVADGLVFYSRKPDLYGKSVLRSNGAFLIMKTELYGGAYGYFFRKP